jgi:hypothetical protein
MTLLAADLAAHTPSPSEFQWWKVREPALAGLDDFDALVAEVQDPATALEREDARLAALVRLAKDDNTAMLALVVVLAPRLAAKVRRFAPSMNSDDAEAEIVAALIERVRRYDLQRRPAKVAANLLWDATRPLRKARDRQRAWTTLTVGLNGTDTAAPAASTSSDGGVELAPELILALAVDAGVITAASAALITATRLRGFTLVGAARLAGIGYEAAKKRRQRAEAALAAWLAPERLGLTERATPHAHSPPGAPVGTGHGPGRPSGHRRPHGQEAPPCPNSAGRPVDDRTAPVPATGRGLS